MFETLFTVNKKVLLIIVSVLAFFFVYRLLLVNKLTVGYDRIPDVSEIFDERTNVMVGITFCKTGIPTGWSLLSAYLANCEGHRNEKIGFNGLQVTKNDTTPALSNRGYFAYPIVAVKEVNLIGTGSRTIDFVQPYVDHSPLGGIIFKQSVKNAQSIETLDPKEYRFIPTHILFWVNAVLLFCVAWLLTNRLFVSFTAFLIYTSVPSFVLSSRLALLENILIPFILLVILFLKLYKNIFRKNKSIAKWLLLLAGVSTGLAIASKETGVSAFILGVSLLISYKVPRRMYIYYLVSSFVVGSAFYIYLALLAPKLALNVLLNQTGRGFFGPLNFLYSIIHPTFTDFPLDGYWLFGFISVFLLIKQLPRYREVTYGFFSVLFVYLICGGPNYPWYSLPFIPFLVLASAILIANIISKPSVLTVLLFFVLPFSSSFYWGYVIRGGIVSTTLVYRLILVGIVVLAFVTSKHSKIGRKLLLPFQITLICVFIFMILGNIRSISYIVEHWGDLPSSFQAL